MIKKETRIILEKPLYIWFSDQNFYIRNKRTKKIYSVVSTGTDDDYEETSMKIIEYNNNEHVIFE